MRKLALAETKQVPEGKFARDCSDRPTGGNNAGRPYSEELRSSVIAAVEDGASYRKAAARHGVSASAVLKWTHRFRQTGSIAAKPMGGDRRSRLKSQRDWLLKRTAAEPGLTVTQLHTELRARGVHVGYLTLRRFMKREKLDRK